MQTEFNQLALDQLRYSIVWEDHPTLYAALDIQQDDQVLVITSAGDNVLNTLLKEPKKVVAIDLNPIQNALLDFKRYLIVHYDYEVYVGLLGLSGSKEVKKVWGDIFMDFPLDSRNYWDTFFQKHPEGIMCSGKLECYLLDFMNTLTPQVQTAFQALLDCTSIEEQHLYFQERINTDEFKENFINYVDKKNLGKARDPRLFKYVGDEVGNIFYKRLLAQSQTVLWKNNFHWLFFFFGMDHLNQNVLPPCYQKENYERLKQNIDKIKIIEGEIVEYLLSNQGLSITKASLSNVFEYASPSEFEEVMNRMADQKRSQSLKVLYWNLLQHQKPFSINGNMNSELVSENASSCFFFQNSYLVNF
ncbi:MAG: BtaA family protein [Reichenbachiella sp.]